MILYTAQIGGDLQMLPRLHTFLQQIRQEQTVPVLLMDLGAASAKGIWHCDVTGGRSTFIVLDGMGYHVANVEGSLAKGQIERLRATITMGLVDQQHVWRYDLPPVRDEGIIVAAASAPALSLCIVAAPAAETTLINRTLTLQSVTKGQVGSVRIDMRTQTITSQAIMELPPKLKPDPTIMASVEFVEEEARFFQKNNP